MFYQYNHRYGTFEGATSRNINSGVLPRLSPDQLNDPHQVVLPRYWVHASEVERRTADWKREWCLAFRDITNSRSERTAIFSMLPKAAISNKAPLLLHTAIAKDISVFYANANSFALDFAARQKIGGNSLNFFIVKQLPFLPPHSYTQTLLDFIVPRVLELTYTAWELQEFAKDLGYFGPPFRWDEARRFLMRCELDALFFHLYGVERADLPYIFDSFWIVAENEIAAYGEYRSKRVIIEMVEAMAALPTMLAPAPKPGQDAIEAPNIDLWQGQLALPPAHPSLAHA